MPHSVGHTGQLWEETQAWLTPGGEGQWGPLGAYGSTRRLCELREGSVRLCALLPCLQNEDETWYEFIEQTTLH